MVPPWRGWRDRATIIRWNFGSLPCISEQKYIPKNFKICQKGKKSLYPFYNKKCSIQCCLKIPVFFFFLNFPSFDPPISTMLSLWQRYFKQFIQVSFFFHCRTSSVSKIPTFPLTVILMLISRISNIQWNWYLTSHEVRI